MKTPNKLQSLFIDLLESVKPEQEKAVEIAYFWIMAAVKITKAFTYNIKQPEPFKPGFLVPGSVNNKDDGAQIIPNDTAREIAQSKNDNIIIKVDSKEFKDLLTEVEAKNENR